MTPKEKGATPFETAPGNDTADSTVEHSRETQRARGLYAPLAWAELGREVKPAKFRGKTKRQARADAIRAKRHQGGTIAAELLGLILLALVACC